MSNSKGRIYQYEGMFLVGQQAASDINGCVVHLKEVLNRASATLIALRKWDERRLAFEIAKQKRGVYFLAYFTCDPVNIQSIERDCNLSEIVLRSMVTRADHLTVDEMKAADGQQELATEGALREAEAAKSAAPTPPPTPTPPSAPVAPKVSTTPATTETAAATES